jgi:hypothetical protein
LGSDAETGGADDADVTWFHRHLLLTKVVLAALIAVPVAAAAVARTGDGAALKLHWDGSRTTAPVTGTFVAPATPAGEHVVFGGRLSGDLSLARGLRLVVGRRSDGARLYDGALRDFAGFDLGSVPAAKTQREFAYQVSLRPGALATGSVSASFHWQTERL